MAIWAYVKRDGEWKMLDTETVERKDVKLGELPERHRQVLATVDVSGIFNLPESREKENLAERLSTVLSGEQEDSVYVFRWSDQVNIEE